MSDVDCSCGSNIEDGIRRFFAPCTQELKCEKCFCETATQSMEITKLPPVLLLHLKRFIVDYSSDWSSISYRKNESAVYLNDNLSVHNDSGALSEFLASDCRITSHMNHETTATDKSFSLSSQMCTSTSKYVLRSVVNHIGSSANCGHYTADAQRGGEQSEWFRFNDACVTPISMTDAIEQSKQTAYMCLYELS
jgi:ubiquitin C-terminal hydrolase